MAKASQRYWLTFPAERAQRPLIWEMSQKFELVFNLRSANVTDEVGIIALELTGEQKVIAAAVKWFRRRGVEVNPIELNVIES
jgi:ABC-type methionine transport system ATPase subunit